MHPRPDPRERHGFTWQEFPLIFTGHHPAGLIATRLRERFCSVRKDCVLVPLHSDNDVVYLRCQVRERALPLKLSLVDQTKLVTATSELARNTIKYDGGGEVQLELLHDGLREGGLCCLSTAGPALPISHWH